MAGKTETIQAPPQKEVAETTDTLPLLDLSDAAVRTLIGTAKKRGYVTHEQVKLLAEEVNSEQVEDVLAMFSEMGVNVVETEETTDEEEQERDEVEAEGRELVEVRQKVPAKSDAKAPAERIDDPVRLYMREIGTVDLLSREGEIAIAKRIEAGREAMIAGLCESPLTFQAIIIWRDELNGHNVLLRHIIDLEATYAGPGARAIPATVGPDGQPIAAAPGASFTQVLGTPTLAPPAAPTAATPFRAAPERVGEERKPEGSAEGEFDDDDMENALSLATIEA